MIQHHTVSLKEVNYQFPLYLYPNVGKAHATMFHTWPEGENGRQPNLDSAFVSAIEKSTGLTFHSDGYGDLRDSFGPEDVLAFLYAALHSPEYRRRYEPMLKLDFPRVPPPTATNQFIALSRLGSELVALHLLESPHLDKLITTYTGPQNPEVGRVGWSEGVVWLDAGMTNARESHRTTKPGTIGFQGVPEDVWNFRIGGYQVCHKWLKDRKGRTLSKEEIEHYQRIVVALADGRVRYPDFTIADHARGVTYYWEHLGLLGDPEYRARWERKRAQYIAAGIEPLDDGGGPEGTLIETHDDERGGLDASRIAAIVDQLHG